MFCLRSIKKNCFIVMMHSFVCYGSQSDFGIKGSDLEKIPYASFRNYGILRDLDTKQKLFVLTWSDQHEQYIPVSNDTEIIPDGSPFVVVRKVDDDKGLLKRCPVFRKKRLRPIKLHLPSAAKTLAESAGHSIDLPLLAKKRY